MFENITVQLGHGVSTLMDRRCVGFQLEMDLLVGVNAQFAAEEPWEFAQEAFQIVALGGFEVLLFIGYFIGINCFVLGD